MHPKFALTMACKVHKVRFYNPKPRAVNSLAFNDAEKWLALSREDASIEIWDVRHAPLLVRCIPGVEQGSVEALGWAGRRLLSTGLGGALLQWDLHTLTVKWSALLTGYAAWCMAVDTAQRWVAVGTEQGYLNLFRVEPEQLLYEKLFDKQEGRIICCQFDKTGNILVTGSIATIRIWDVATGHARHRLVTSRRGRDNLVWSLAVLSDLTIVAGDSNGRLTFWDGNVAEQIESFATHQADVLAVAVSPDERSVYCSGVDPAVVSFTRVPSGGAGGGAGGGRMRWVKNLQRHVHEHDVRALAVVGARLVSLGADGYVAMSSYPPKWLLRVPPLPPAPRVAAAITTTTTAASTALAHKLLLLKYTNHLEVWRLGKYSTSEAGNPVFSDKDNNINTNSNQTKGKLEEDSASLGLKLQDLKRDNGKNTLQLSDQPLKLVSIRAKGKQQLQCCAMSPNGQFIVYSTDDTIRAFYLELDGEEPYLLKLSVSAPDVTACTHAAFTQDSRTLLLHSGGGVAVLHVDRTGATLHHHIAAASHLKEDCLLHLTTGTAARSGATYVACAGGGGGVAVWCRRADDTKFKHHATLPRYSCAPSALAIDAAGENLVVVYVDQKLVEYDLRQRRCNDWPDTRLPQQWRDRTAAITGVAPHPLHPHLLLLHDDTSVWLLNKQRLLAEVENSEPVSKKKMGNKKKANFEIFPFKYLAGWAWLGEEEAVAVEVPPENIISQLPPALATKRFPSL